jgi:hypothetical protein
VSHDLQIGQADAQQKKANQHQHLHHGHPSAKPLKFGLAIAQLGK